LVSLGVAVGNNEILKGEEGGKAKRLDRVIMLYYAGADILAGIQERTSISE
jgi:hypothetical protein